MQNRVQIAHQYQWNLHLILDGFQLTEKDMQVHTVFQGLGGGSLNNRTVGQRIAERNANFNHGNTTTLHGENHIACALECGAACAKVQRQEFLVLTVCEKLIDLIHLVTFLHYLIFTFLHSEGMP